VLFPAARLPAWGLAKSLCFQTANCLDAAGKTFAREMVARDNPECWSRSRPLINEGNRLPLGGCAGHWKIATARGPPTPASRFRISSASRKRTQAPRLMIARQSPRCKSCTNVAKCFYEVASPLVSPMAKTLPIVFSANNPAAGDVTI